MIIAQYGLWLRNGVDAEEINEGIKKGKPGPDHLVPGSSFTWSPHHTHIFQSVKPVCVNFSSTFNRKHPTLASAHSGKGEIISCYNWTNFPRIYQRFRIYARHDHVGSFQMCEYDDEACLLANRQSDHSSLLVWDNPNLCLCPGIIFNVSFLFKKPLRSIK